MWNWKGNVCKTQHSCPTFSPGEERIGKSFSSKYMAKAANLWALAYNGSCGLKFKLQTEVECFTLKTLFWILFLSNCNCFQQFHKVCLWKRYLLRKRALLNLIFSQKSSSNLHTCEEGSTFLYWKELSERKYIVHFV